MGSDTENSPPARQGLRKVRVYEGLTQTELNSLSDVSVSTISAAENGGLPSERIQFDLLHAINTNPKKRDSSHSYVLADLFPTESSAPSS